MARPRSPLVQDVRQLLINRLQDHFRPPGTRFPSARAIAAQYGISYQTAHRLLTELAAEGKLRRQGAVGTFVPGETERLERVQFVFHPRARRKDSFGAYLLQCLEGALARAGISSERTWTDQTPRSKKGSYPVLWEVPRAVQAAADAKRFALLINNRPPPGLGGAFIDAISSDDHSGGVWAAQYLKSVCPSSGPFIMLAGPREDVRSRERVAGFLDELPHSRILHADGWFFENGLKLAKALAATRPAGVFCANDRLAQAVLQYYRRTRHVLPKVVGFDDAPIAAKLHLSSVAIPWERLSELAVEIIRSRLSGSLAPAHLVVLPHRVTIRS